MKPLSGPTRRQIVTGAVALSTGLLLPNVEANAGPAPQPLWKRKSIDSLGAPELDNYKHAFNIIKQRSVGNPGRQDGYVYQAALHNRVRQHNDPDNPAGACEHGSEMFFPWHRAHLAGFEKLLRESDPPKTADVTIPYWDWTKPPTGTMVPKAFEDEASPLFNNGRRKSGTPATWDGDDIREMVRDPAWDLFAGRPKKPNPSFGTVEMGPHNTMHGRIGQTMGNPSTAANDPIYWSFHAYIDIIWARWQRLHTQTFGCPSCKLWLEPAVFATNEKVTTQNWNYEYDYDFSPDGPAVTPVAAGGPAATPLPMLDVGDRTASAALNVAPSPTRKLLKIEKVTPLADASYRVHVYVHPANVKPGELSPEARRPYLVRTVTIWQSSGHHPEGSDVIIDLTRALQGAGANQVVTVLTDGAPGGETGAAQPMLDAALPKVQNLFRGLAIEER